MQHETIVVEKKDGVAVITLNRPEKLNAVNLEMRLEFLDALENLEVDEEIRVLIITGAGRAFCAGADISRFGEDNADLRKKEARQWGIINRVVPEGDLMAAAMEMAAEIKKMAPLSIKAIKQAVNRGMEGYEYSQQVIANLQVTEDAKEEAKAFMEKRDSQFKGK